jgi:hypothetical protein
LGPNGTGTLVVLKSVLLLLMFSTILRAQDSLDVVVSLNKKKSYQKSQEMLMRHLGAPELDQIQRPLSEKEQALFFINSNKLRRPKDVIRLATFQIRKIYKEPHKKVIMALKKQDVASLEPETPRGLKSIYFNLAKAYYTIASKMKFNSPVAAKAEKRAMKYAQISQDLNYQYDQAEKILQAFKLRREKIQKKTKMDSTAIFLGQFSWQDYLKLKGNGSEVEVFSTTKAFALGYETGTRNSYTRTSHQFIFMSGSGNVGDNNHPTVNYFQRSVGVNMIWWAWGKNWLIETSNSEIGFRIPVGYRLGAYSVPAGYTLESKGQLTAGLALEARWKIENWFLNWNLAKMTFQKSFLWGFSVGKSFE